MSLEEKILSGVETKGISLMTHLVVGYPDIETNKKVLEQMHLAGVELVEFQFPFSEPVADGPLFAMANQASLEMGTTTDDCFQLLAWAKAQNFCFETLMMGYYNTVFKTGEKRFCERLKEVGAKGLIVPDLPLEEAGFLLDCCEENGLEFIHLLTPTTTSNRLKILAAEINKGSSFTYAVARKGTTGKETSFDEGLKSYLTVLKSEVKKPIGLGFGISTPEEVASLKGSVELAILGSKVLRVLESDGVDAVGLFLKSLR